MRMARIARPGAIYDASAAAQTFSEAGAVEISKGREDVSGNEEKGIKGRRRFRTYGGFRGV